MWEPGHKGGGSNRVNRGGSWNNEPRNVRSANRNRNTPDNRNNNLGFRLLSTGDRQHPDRHGAPGRPPTRSDPVSGTARLPGPSNQAHAGRG